MKSYKKKIAVQPHPGIISKGFLKYRGNFYVQYLIPINISPEMFIFELREIIQPHFKGMHELYSNKGQIRKKHGRTIKILKREERDKEIWKIECENRGKLPTHMIPDIINNQLRMKHYLPKDKDLSVSQINRILSRMRRSEKSENK